MKKQGFSLVELIVTVAIMAVLMAIVAPSLAGGINRKRIEEITSVSQIVDFDNIHRKYEVILVGNIDSEEFNGKCISKSVFDHFKEDIFYEFSSRGYDFVGDIPEFGRRERYDTVYGTFLIFERKSKGKQDYEGVNNVINNINFDKLRKDKEFVLISDDQNSEDEDVIVIDRIYFNKHVNSIINCLHVYDYKISGNTRAEEGFYLIFEKVK